MQITWTHVSNNDPNYYKNKHISTSIFQELVTNTNAVISQFCSSHTCSSDTNQIFTLIPDIANQNVITAEKIKEKLNYFDDNNCKTVFYTQNSGFKSTDKGGNNQSKYSSDNSSKNVSVNDSYKGGPVNDCNTQYVPKYQCSSHNSTQYQSHYLNNDSNTCSGYCSSKNQCDSHMSGQNSTKYSSDNSNTYSGHNNSKLLCSTYNSNTRIGHYTNNLSSKNSTNNGTKYSCSTYDSSALSSQYSTNNSGKQTAVYSTNKSGVNSEQNGTVS